MKIVKNYPLAATMILFFILGATKCVSQEVTPSPDDEGTGCIQGTVTYKSPLDSSPLPCAAATVSLTLPGNDRPFADTQTDKAGRYCIAVPLGHDTVDLKVWGLTYMNKENYICQGGKAGIDLEAKPRNCGEGCMEIDVEVECKESYLRRRR